MQLREIHLHPVKAMAGHRVGTWPYDPRGLLGDRGWALVDDAGLLATGKDGRRFARHDEIFAYSARLDRPGATPVVTGPDVADLPVDDPRVAAAASAAFGVPVRALPEAETAWAVEEKGLKDDAAVSLIGTATLRALGELADADPVDPRHLRANLVVETDEPYVEETWARVRVGEAEFEVLEPATRCRMIDLAIGDLPARPGLLRSLRPRRGRAAVYLRPVGSGELHVGDEVVPF